MEIGSIVEFTNPYEDEIGQTFTVLELEGGEALIQFVCNLTFKPTQWVKVEEIKLKTQTT